MNKNGVRKNSTYGIFMCLGAGFGLIFGKSYFENPGMGLVYGCAIGLIIAGILNFKNKV